jgi:hypothetical protein
LAAAAGVESNDSSAPQLGNAVACGIGEGSAVSSLYRDDGGQAGIVCSVGGSGGQMSVASGIALDAGAASSVGGRLPCPALGDFPAGGQVRFGAGAGVSTPGDSLMVSPGGAGTVCAHNGAGFCMGTACFGSLASSGGSVFVQSGRVSRMGLAGNGSPSEAVSLMDCMPLSLTGGATGTVRAQTGVVSVVGTAVTGGSGGVDSWVFSGSGSTSMSQSSPGVSSCIRGSGEYVGQGVFCDRVWLLFGPVGCV